MAIYTGNNGRVYIARRTSSGLTGTRTLNIVAGKAIASGQKLFARLVRGTGNGAQFRAGNAVSAHSQQLFLQQYLTYECQ